MPLINLNSQESRPLIDQIVSGIQQQVDERILRPGTRLPSIRQFAQDHQISRFTVVQAYDRLVASGYVKSRRGSGFYIAKPLQPPVAAEPACQLNRAVDVLWLLHKSLKDTRLQYMPGCGWLPADWQDETCLQRGLRSLARLPASLLTGYGQAAGFVPLRQDVQHRLSDMGVRAELNQIITTHGASHGLDLVGRYLVQPGAAVLVDDPGFFNLFGYLQSLGAILVGVPRTLDGPDTEAMERLIIEHEPKVFFTNTALHNPTGASLSQACAYRLLQLAEKYDLMIVEDDVYGDFHPGQATRLVMLDQLERVIYLSSFSKTISANVRVGYLACRPELAHALVDLKLLSGLTSTELTERLIHQVLSEGYYRKHLERVRVRLQAAREHTLTRLEQGGLEVYTEPEHGMFLWARFKEGGCNTAELANRAARQGIMLAPGNIFRPYQEPSPYFRFNVAFCAEPAIFTFLEQAAVR